MKLLSLTLNGHYKGLKNQTFDFSQSHDGIIALVGLNGSGKSQLLELIAEIFAYIERYQRADFKNLKLPFAALVIYKIRVVRGEEGEGIFRVEIDDKGTMQSYMLDENSEWRSYGLEQLPYPDFIVGYASGLNENLQRAFMKNAFQYFDVMRVRMNRRKELQNVVAIGSKAEINKKYTRLYPHIFQRREQIGNWADYLIPEHEIDEADTPASRFVLIDYDTAQLVVASLAVLPSHQVTRVLSELSFNAVNKLTITYDLRKGIFEEDSIKDIQLLLRVVQRSTPDSFQAISKKTDDKQFDEFGLDHLAGRIVFDLTNPQVKKALNEENGGDPVRFFNRLYKLQLLGAKSWSMETKSNIKKAGFIGTVKKPLKVKMPLVVEELILMDKDGRCVDFNDLSDGEAQLMQILAAAKVFSQDRALFLLDEPETHLNPAWRTYFHKYLSRALCSDDSAQTSNRSHVFLSTHSPFMVSSLKRNNVYQSRRNDNGLIVINVTQNETYGASFDVLIKELFGLRSLISQSVIEEIREHLEQGDSQAKEWIEQNLGLSAEKAYLIRKLSQ